MTIQYTQSDVQRFWSCVDQSAGPDQCWPWLLSLSDNSYGQFCISGQGGRSVKAHRFAYTAANGQIPDGLLICHHCDNPGCCNPVHLFLGTHADNSHDMTIKGRAAKGEANARSKLTEHQVYEIRALYVANSISQRKLAEEFGVSQMAICYVLNRQTWACVK